MSSKIERYLRGRASLFGSRLLGWSRCPGLSLAWKNRWDEVHYECLTRLKDNGALPRRILDIGANDGRWSEMAQEIFRPEKIYLVEPQPNLVQEAMARAPKSEGNWISIQTALGDGKGETRASLKLTENRAASSLLAVGNGLPKSWGVKQIETLEVEVVSLDQLLESKRIEHVDFVKMDIQGFEGRVLAGGRRFFEKVKHMVVEVSLKEIYEGQPLLPEILQLCTEYGFKLDDISEASREWPGGRLWQVDLWLSK